MSKKLHIKTYGCQMNVYDSVRMADVLAPLGYVPTEQAENADLVILNTCHIREKAAEKVFSDLGRLRRLQAAQDQAGKRMLLAVGGCVAQAEGDEIRRRAPYVDLVFGPQTYHRLPELVERALRAENQPGRNRRGITDTEFPVEPKFDLLPQPGPSQGISAFLAVQEGCDKFCTYCVVPYTRGAEYSRPVSSVIAEARGLMTMGVREITLLGQNVNAYHGEGPDGSAWPLGRLIRALAEIEGLARLRYTTSHPLEMDETLIAAHREVPQLMPFLHLPVQSGSDRILAAMNRRHSVDDYRRTIEQLRMARPDLALSSDFIVGFPGETDAEFRATLTLVREMGFAQAYSFKFSARPGTPAAALNDPVPEPVKTARLGELQSLLNTQQTAFNRGFVGRHLDVLFERAGRHPDQLVGRSPYMQSVHVTAPATLIGQIVPVEIVAGLVNSLRAQLPEAEGAHAA